ncbi:MAG: transposase [Candidatus Wallbacteria bacterium]|nr:transposase [Candidatus Wallbacteria bacterium]
MDREQSNKHRRSIRLPCYDYAAGGAYFVTVCTKGRECLLGEITDGEMKINHFGEIVTGELLRTAKIRPNVSIDEYVVMPNHFHAIIVIDTSCRGTLQRAPTMESFGKPTTNSIPTIVRLIKSITTKRINLTRGMPAAPVWQRGYFDRIIRDALELERIRQYIAENPGQ